MRCDGSRAQVAEAEASATTKHIEMEANAAKKHMHEAEEGYVMLQANVDACLRQLQQAQDTVKQAGEATQRWDLAVKQAQEQTAAAQARVHAASTELQEGEEVLREAANECD